MLWPIERAQEVLRWYRDFLPRAPDDLNGFFAFLTRAARRPIPGGAARQDDVRRRLVLHRSGDQAEATFAPIRAMFGAPALDWVGPIPHPALQQHVRRALSAGLQWYWKADFFKELPDAAIERHVEFGQAADAGIVHDASLPDRRRGEPGATDATPWATAMRSGPR